MYFLNTKMHMVTFSITMFEIVMLVFQVVYLLERPSDKKRLQYLILLSFLILYNLCSGLLPDKDIPIPISLQTVIAFMVGFLMSMYVVFYFYKVLELRHIRFFATYGLLLFLLVPFLFLFVVPYLLTGNADVSRRMTVVIPFIYALAFIYYTTKALRKKYRSKYLAHPPIKDPLRQHATAAYIGMLCWAALPVIVFFGDFQVLEHSVTNAGFLMMTVIYVKQIIQQSRREWHLLQESQRQLRESNRELQNQVRERTAKLEQLYNERKTMFSNLAHEIKTPVTLVSNYLNDHLANHVVAPPLQIVQSNFDRIIRDVNNFFDLDRIDKGFSLYDHSQVSNFSAALQLKTELFRLAAIKKGVTITFEVEQNICVKGHPGAIDRIINNLIDNAIKYTRSQGKVEVKLQRTSAGVEFIVSDTGIGIPENQTESIFEPYFQISREQKSGEGMGLGLSIVNKIVKDLQGQIAINSKESIGTVVTIGLQEVPEASDCSLEIEENMEPNELNAAPINDSINHIAAPYLMILEDNVSLLELLKGSLEKEYNVLIAHDGKEGLSKANNAKRLDLIISDVRMPEVDGFTFFKTLHEQERFKHVPVIFVTASAEIENKLKGLKLGAIDYIQKPFEVSVLKQKIKAILHNQKEVQTAIVRSAAAMLLSTAAENKSSAASAIELNAERYN